MRSIIFLLFLALSLSLQAQWQAAGDKIKTPWADKIDPGNVLGEYPRPMMERAEWKNLNGLWKYALAPANRPLPASWDGNILVPFPVESSLSGVQKKVGEDEVLWYERTFSVPQAWRRADVLLHFGAVDWYTEVWLNDIKIGSHTGGYTPFHFNITPYLNRSSDQTLTVSVWDPTDQGYQPRGKQVSEPQSI